MVLRYPASRLKYKNDFAALCCKKCILSHQVSEAFLGTAASYQGEKLSSTSNCGSNWVLQGQAWHELALKVGSGGCGEAWWEVSLSL